MVAQFSFYVCLFLPSSVAFIVGPTVKSNKIYCNGVRLGRSTIFQFQKAHMPQVHGSESRLTRLQLSPFCNKFRNSCNTCIVAALAAAFASLSRCITSACVYVSVSVCD